MFAFAEINLNALWSIFSIFENSRKDLENKRKELLNISY
jgi:hypothetical protein